MPFILLLIAIVLIVTGIRGTSKQLGSLLVSDLTGPNNFGIFAFAFFLIGALGYIPAFKKLSDAFLLLVIVVILISNDKNGQGFFAGIQSAMNGTSNGSSNQTTLTNLPAITSLPSTTIGASTLGTLSPLPPLVTD
jgi:hypothetical protein